MASASRRYHPLLLFIGSMLMVNVAASLVARTFAHSSHHSAIAAGACFDMMVMVPAMYYFLVVRGGGQPLAGVFAVLCLSALRASVVFPGVVRSEFAAAGAEIGVLAFVAYRVTRGIRRARTLDSDSDILEQFEAAARELIPLEQAAKALAGEAAMFYYAFFSWRALPRCPAGWRGFSTHQKSGMATLLVFLASLSLIEIPLMSLVAHRWSRAAAWTLTALGVYGLVWVIALSRSLVLQPLRLCDASLEVHKGFLWKLQIPLAEVAAVRRVTDPSPNRRQLDYLCAALGGDPQFLVYLKNPLTAQGPYGLKKRVSVVGLLLDEPQAFADALERVNIRIG